MTSSLPFRRLLAAFVLGIVAGVPADAGDLFVKPGGSGSACTQAAPCPLATVLAGDQDGDRIFVAAGTYTGAGTEVVLIDRDIELLGGWDGAGAGAVKRDPVAYQSIIDGQNARRGATVTHTGATLDGFVIRNGNASGTGAQCGGGSTVACGGGVLVAAPGVTIADSRIVDNVADSGARVEDAIGAGGGVMGYYAHDLSLVGNTIAANTASVRNGGSGGGIALDGCLAPRISGNRIINNTGTLAGSGVIAGWGGGVALTGSYSTITEKNLFRGNRAGAATSPSYGNALYTWYACGAAIANCISSDAAGSTVVLGFFNGQFNGNRVLAGADYRVVWIFNGTPEETYLANNVLTSGAGTEVVVFGDGFDEHPVVTTLVHNTIIGNGATTGVFADDYATLTMTDTIVAGHDRGTDLGGTGVLTPDHNLFWNNATDGITGTNAVFGDPLFVNAPQGDFHIQQGSAAHDAGANAGVSRDIDGEARPGIGGFDIGADEIAPWRFDFGTPTSPVAAGYTGVTHTTAYTAERGFGWTYGTIASRDRGTADDLTRDFNFTHTGTFVVDLPDGPYRVTLTMGDATAGHGQMAVFLENLQVATVSTAGGEFKTLTFDVSVTDGQLTVWLNDLGGSDPNVVINGLAIKKALPVKLDLGTVSSPVAPGYTRVTHATPYLAATGSGWLGGIIQSRDRGTADPLKRDLAFTPLGLFGVFLANDLYDITLTLGDAAAAHDQMGIAVQGAPFDSITAAKNQFATRTWRTCVCDNQLRALLDDLGGGDANVVVNAVEVAPPPVPRFDFGTAGSPVAPGYLQVTHATVYTPSRGYGWLSGTIGSRDRGIADALTRDLNFTPDGTFVVDLLPGRYTVTVKIGDAAAAHDEMGIYLEGELVDTVNRGVYSIATKSYAVTVSDGQLTVRLRDLGGSDPNVVINGLQIE